ncbi:thiamine pyrophosphate-binding protein [Nocardioides currus]|uniref:Acetolactate synthase n=1 Tax=Nocardioides currus TaxID=2133958 RepID=A0A2R7Z1Y8_9ACTN|nr:thiamine pyrophosphate-binding protein [Nocardioides currus]PUA82633.1 acetolactate synthase [Nocardioides currus]
MHYHQALAHALRGAGTEVVFGVLGDANLFAMDSFVRETGGRYVSFAHEGGAVLAAGGFTSASAGRLGVATVTHGPALTNCVTALVDAARSRTPLLLLAGDTATGDRDNLQNIDQAAVVSPTGALFERARTAQSVVEDVQRAVRLAWSERRPVVLDVPVELQWQEVDLPSSAFDLRTVTARPLAVPETASLEDALGILASARRPIVLGGRGAADARAELTELAAQLGAPVATTLRGKGLFAGHPVDLGIFGTLSHDLASETIARADVVVAFGAGLNAWTTSKGELVAGKRVVHVDHDPSTLVTGIGATVSLLGDAAMTARALLDGLREAEVEPTSFADATLEAALEERQAALVVTPDSLPTTADGLDVELLWRQIDQALPADRTLVVDDGRFIITAYRELGVAQPAAYVHTCSFASIGLAVATAVGAHAAAPQRPILVVCGDGGFMSAGLTEVSTLVRAGVPALLVVLNDGAYGAEHMQFRARGMDPTISTFDWPDLAPVAEALGARGFTVRTHADLAAALAEVVVDGAVTGPVLLDVKVDPDRVPTPGY